MHRSGTSALGGILRLLGFDLGADLLKPNQFNPTGYWENQSIVRLNERVLSRSGAPAGRMSFCYPTIWTALICARSSIRRRTLSWTKHFPENWNWVLKDPRFSMLIDFWLPYLRGRNVSFIHVVRHPNDVANSLERRDGFPKERGLLLWFLQNLNAEYFTRGLNRCFVDYEDYIRDWRGSLEKAFQQLDISHSEEVSKYQAKGDIDEFLY